MPSKFARRVPNYLLSLIAATLVFCATAPAGHTAVWSFGDDYSVAQNPNGAWSYGWLSSFGDTMGLYNGISQASSGVPEWRSDGAIDHGVACKNMTGGPMDGNYGSQYWETDMAGLHPGEFGDMGTVRWTAPSACLISISARFTGQSFGGGGTTTDVHVVRNGQSIFDGVINGFAGRGSLGFADAFGLSPVQAFETVLVISAGDTIDFCCGYGNGNYGYDITGLSATITARDDAGLVRGTVTEAEMGSPLGGAVVRSVGGSETTEVLPDGSYSLLLPVGGRTIEVSYPGLRTVTAQVDVPAGGALTRDFSLYTDYGPTYFVSSTGDDSADGRSPATAWRTISNGDAKGLVVAGDTVLVAAGAYPQATYTGVQLGRSGEPGLPIVYRALGKVVIDQTDIPKPTSTSYGFWLTGHDVKLEGFEIIGARWGVYLAPASHDNSITDCTIHDLIPGDPAYTDIRGWCGGVYIASSSSNSLHHNLVYNTGSPGGGAAACIMTTGSSQGNKIYNNTFAHSWAGVHAWSNAGVVGAHDIRNNIIAGMWDHGVDNGQSTGCTGSHNLFFGNPVDYGTNAAPGGGDLVADPRFAPEGYLLLGDSPAVDAGEDLGLAFSGLAPDIGAFEYAPDVAGRTGYMKSLPDGALVALADPKAATVSNATFADRSFYIEELDRASGIKVVPDTVLPPVALGDRITLSGTMATEVSGERVIRAGSIDSRTAGQPVKPLGMSGKSMAAKVGLSPRGLLARMSGWVTYRSADGSCIYVDDGSRVLDGSGNIGTRVALDGLVLPLGVSLGRDQFVTVTGLIGAFKDGSASGAVMHVRGGSDIAILPVLRDEITRRASWVSEHLGGDAATLPFSFGYDGRPSSELLGSWNLESASAEIDGKGTQRTLTYTDPSTELQVRCESVEYYNYPTVEWTVYLKNTGSSDTPIIEDLMGLDSSLSIGATGTPVLHYNVGSPAGQIDYQPLEAALTLGSSMSLGASGGRSSESSLPYFNLGSDDGGTIVVVGWPGQWMARFARGAGNSVAVTAGQEQTRFSLHPGEEVRAPLIVLQFYNGDRVRSQNVWRRWMLDYNVPRPGGELPAPRYAATTFDTYGGLSTTADEFYFMNRYLQAGVKLDVWWVDAGWYYCNGGWPNVGTWEVDLTRYPNGQREFFDYAHTNNMRSLVWYEPERVVGGTWIASNHPEWVLGGSGGGLLNLGNPDAWNWLVNHVDNLMSTQGVDDYRQDFNMAPLGYWRGNDAADRQGITENKHVTGYLAYWDELRRRHPGALIDSCASGGRRNDLETLRRAVPLWRSDYAYEPIGTQCHTYGISSWMPFSGHGVRTNDVYTFRSNMAPSLVDTRNARDTGHDFSVLADLVAQWRSVAGNYLGDYYPLTPYSLATNVWVAWQFDRPEFGEGVVQAFRRGTGANSTAVLKLCGLDPAASYVLTNLDDGMPQLKTGQSLMDTGLTVQSSSAPWAVVIKYRKQ